MIDISFEDFELKVSQSIFNKTLNCLADHIHQNISLKNFCEVSFWCCFFLSLFIKQIKTLRQGQTIGILTNIHKYIFVKITIDMETIEVIVLS